MAIPFVASAMPSLSKSVERNVPFEFQASSLRWTVKCRNVCKCRGHEAWRSYTSEYISLDGGLFATDWNPLSVIQRWRVSKLIQLFPKNLLTIFDILWFDLLKSHTEMNFSQEKLQKLTISFPYFNNMSIWNCHPRISNPERSANLGLQPVHFSKRNWKRSAKVAPASSLNTWPIPRKVCWSTMWHNGIISGRFAAHKKGNGFEVILATVSNMAISPGEVPTVWSTLTNWNGIGCKGLNDLL